MGRPHATAEERRVAKIFGATDALRRRLVDLERLLPPPGPTRFVPVGMPMDPCPTIRLLCADARRHQAGRRWIAAKRAFEAAERLVELTRPTIDLLRRRAAEEERQSALRARGRRGALAHREQAEERASPYVQRARELSRRYPSYSRHRIAMMLSMELPLGGDDALGVRQIERHLKAAGIAPSRPTGS
jgi:hypothetical protein